MSNWEKVDDLLNEFIQSGPYLVNGVELLEKIVLEIDNQFDFKSFKRELKSTAIYL
jgi:hypothetical protein